jgi:hypothetical protein
VLEGRLAHALDLAFEHLEEFRPDDLVVGALSRALTERGDAALSAEFEALRQRFSRGGRAARPSA